MWQFSYEGLSAGDAVKHIARFTSGIWQIHPFCEGNTRSTAVFIIKYLKTFGFSVNNEIFAENSWYFRNSLARANYNDLGKGISATTIYLERFFENLLMGYQNELKNRFIHVDYREQSAIQSAIEKDSKCNNCTYVTGRFVMKTEMDKDFSIRMGGASICSKDRAENRRLQILQSDIQADLDIEELEDKSGISF